MIFSLFGSRLVLSHLRDCKGGCLSLEIMSLSFVGKHFQKCDRENQEWWWRQIKSIVPLVLPIVPLSEIKNFLVVLSFYITIMKRRTLQACSFKA